MELHGKSILGDALADSGAETFESINPATGQKLGPAFHKADAAAIGRAMQLAEAAFTDYRQRSGAQRADFLEKIAAGIEALGDKLVERAVAETALPPARITGERGRTTGQLRLFASLAREGSWVDARIDTALPERQPLPRPDLRRMLIPLGPVVVFSASNFPLAFSVAGGDTASALAAGCPVVVKSHWAHAGVSEMVGRVIQEAAKACGLHPGVFSLLQGRGHDIGNALARHPLTRAIGFTGSRRGGLALLSAANLRPEPIPVYAEMGSINPVFVLPGAMEQRGQAIAQGLVQSVTLGVGQFCTNPGLVVARAEPRLEQFVAQVSQSIAAVAPASMLYSGLCEAYREGVDRLAAAPGVSVVGKAAQAADPARTQAGPIVFRTDATAFLANPDLSEEVFGPATVVVACPKEGDLAAIARGLEGQLTATIHGTEDDLKKNAELVAILQDKAGRLIFNAFPTGVEVSPAMNHGGPFPATTDPHYTSVGTAAILRFARPICYQGFPQSALPPELRDANPGAMWRLVNAQWRQGNV
ncbi:MAG: aldehyde dehydrogenase (NADP(+)) [Planctomycetota bacterium]|nr:aldehyde dehydrogenase (NADP(+)) [Planctomycetota bacterium]